MDTSKSAVLGPLPSELAAIERQGITNLMQLLRSTAEFDAMEDSARAMFSKAFDTCTSRIVIDGQNFPACEGIEAEAGEQTGRVPEFMAQVLSNLLLEVATETWDVHVGESRTDTVTSSEPREPAQVRDQKTSTQAANPPKKSKKQKKATKPKSARSGKANRFRVVGEYNTESVGLLHEERTESRSGEDYFVPSSQRDLERFACLEWGDHYFRISQPEGRPKIVPRPCGRCEPCTEYKKHLKLERYVVSRPAPVSTVLVGTFPTPDLASHFAGLSTVRTRMPNTRRVNSFAQRDRRGPEEPCLVRIIWDAEATQEKADAIAQHAERAGAGDVTVEVRHLPAEEFLDWLPDHLTIKGSKGRITTCRFSKNGWSKILENRGNWRNGRTETVDVPGTSSSRFETIQSQRSKEIADSYQLWVSAAYSRNVSPQSRPAMVEEALQRERRAQYVNCADWLDRWEKLEPENLGVAIDFINDYLLGKNPSAREWQGKTFGPRVLVVSVAKYLNGEMDATPAITLAAEKLGYVSALAPHIDPEFLARLTDQLTPLDLLEPETFGLQEPDDYFDQQDPVFALVA